MNLAKVTSSCRQLCVDPVHAPMWRSMCAVQKQWMVNADNLGSSTATFSTAEEYSLLGMSPFLVVNVNHFRISNKQVFFYYYYKLIFLRTFTCIDKRRFCCCFFIIIFLDLFICKTYKGPNITFYKWSNSDTKPLACNHNFRQTYWNTNK
jgi:hypothetical protein